MQITDEYGKPYDRDFPEPPPGSVVMSSGLSGTAWQRRADDGLWYRMKNGGGKTWDHILGLRLVYFVHAALAPKTGQQIEHCPPQYNCPACQMTSVACHNHREVAL